MFLAAKEPGGKPQLNLTQRKAKDGNGRDKAQNSQK
jgi:hypothetical protein